MGVSFCYHSNECEGPWSGAGRCPLPAALPCNHDEQNAQRETPMIIVTGGVLATAATADELRALSLEHVHRSRGEPGCISHDVHASLEDPLRLVFFERWDNLAALKTHFGVQASREFGRRLAALAGEPPWMHIYEAAVVTP
jgi:quinol monooxygenase YgiN